MTGEIDLKKLLAAMTPKLLAGVHVSSRCRPARPFLEISSR